MRLSLAWFCFNRQQTDHLRILNYYYYYLINYYYLFPIYFSSEDVSHLKDFFFVSTKKKTVSVTFKMKGEGRKRELKKK